MVIMPRYSGSLCNREIPYYHHECCECCVRPKVKLNVEPLRDVTQGEGNYGPRTFITTARDAFLTIEERQRLNMAEENKGARYHRLGTYRHYEAGLISTALNCLRRERLRRFMCSNNQEVVQEKEDPAFRQMATVLSNVRTLLPRMGR